MDDRRQELIQASLDGELDDEGRARLQKLAAADPELAAILEEHEALQADLQAMVEDPGPELTDRIMAALPDQPDAPPFITRIANLLRSLQRPVAVPAWQMALLVLALGGVLVYSANRGGAPAPVPVAEKAAPAPQPALAPQPAAKAHLAAHTPATACPVPRLMTRFLLHAPKAKNVALVGDFNDWAREGTPMTDPDENGVWTVSVPLQPGRYQYKFLVNGKTWVVEPDAPAYHPDGFGGRNSLLEI